MFHNCSISYCVTLVGSGGIKELRNPLVASMLHFGGSGGIKELRNPLVASMLHFGGSLGDRILELVQF